MKYSKDITELIGKTPLLRLQRLIPERKVFGKCEFMNPISIKDRPIFQIFKDAEIEEKLRPGDTVIECTSGNTGMAVAYISAINGYHPILIMSEIQSVERRQILKALGAELILTPAELGTEGSRQKLKEILEENPDFFYVGQHVNPANPKAHYSTTGPELWEDTEGEIDILIAGLGTGGTICGAGSFLKEKNPNIKLIAVEPHESPYISQGIFRPHKMMGTAPGFVPEILNKEIIDEIFLVKQDDAFSMCREIAKKEGILVGISSGAVCKAAKEISQRIENDDTVIVGILADTGQRYLSVEGLF
ncbi:MAG: cysteine synthase A [Candidatus Heimdallarchaeota archaeon]|nr:cysteine synthase A [Candidatus Heimdallarchaeota archaeon]MCK4954038.1 cysteine synthase A [Candidatus Heimdallarchaeota archaeon]